MTLPLRLRLFLLWRKIARKFDFLKSLAQSRYFIVAATVVLLCASVMTLGLVRIGDGAGTWPDYARDDAVNSLPENGEFSVTFSDPQLEDVIRNTIGKTDGEDILVADLETITFLNIGKLGITDLNGIGFCSNLDTLIAWDNDISDISPLSGLDNLVYLYLGNNGISDLSPLSGLENLRELYLWYNRVGDLTAISVLTGITRLDVSFNEISDFTPLEPLENLTWLYIEGNHIAEDLSLDFLPDNVEIYPGTREDPNLMRLIEGRAD